MLNSHPLRFQVVSEMHLRPMPPLVPPCRLVQIVRLVEHHDRGAERSHAMKRLAGAVAEDDRERHVAGTLPSGIGFAWERHSEASTATLILPSLSGVPGEDVALAWLEGFPGRVMRAVRVSVVATEEDAAPLLEAAAFKEQETVSSRFGRARIWSDFRMREGDGYGRLIVAAGGTHPADLGRIIQQLQELGNYRNLALMGLPVAQAEATAVLAIENGLVSVTERLQAGADDQSLLDELIQLAAMTASLRAATAYRMGATAAYGRIVEDRLEALEPEKVEGYQSLAEFTERRLLPALRTCASFRERLESVSARIEQATAMIRTRVDLQRQDQNRDILLSMETSAKRQLRLQRVVEGLSVFAVSYYAVGLLSYLLKGMAHDLPVRYEVAVAILVVPTVVLLWLLLRWRTREIERDQG